MSKGVTCSPFTDRRTDGRTRRLTTEGTLSGFHDFFRSTYHQGSAQKLYPPYPPPWVNITQPTITTTRGRRQNVTISESPCYRLNSTIMVLEQIICSYLVDLSRFQKLPHVLVNRGVRPRKTSNMGESLHGPPQKWL